MQHLQDFLDRLLTQFVDATDQLGERDYYSCYKNAGRVGLLIPFVGSAPDNFGARAIDLMQRLVGVQGPIAQAEADLQKLGAGAAFNLERGRLGVSIRTIITDALAFREMVNDEAQRRQGALD